MKVYFATDHAGYEMKEALLPYVEGELGLQIEDLGAHDTDPNDDYPDLIQRAAKQVSRDAGGSLGIILGGSGQGEAMVANRFPNVRCTVYYGGTLDIIKLSREHNNANMLSLGARFITLDEAKAAVKLWIETSFSEEDRHSRRIKKIEEIWPYR